jgi:hypothetical protein
MDAAKIQKFAHSFPDVIEAPHFHFTSFRIDGKIFATMPPGAELLHVFVSDEDREIAVTAHPAVCSALSWGKRIVGVRIDLNGADADLVRDLLRAAYDFKAGRR